ncbi:hypothetical protein DYBT9275_01410 [Dyadobacter sp. CECT 9275]|uniref:Alkaline phosphatase n=1 Tax=Dyadobacter helix TaxID=2822344 RepID=A0A916NB37_9BACT|nr:alkaline phosphatase [Dyadobacter sp. CECT 9275]CAG4994521.1 hypothetical protein DYBT9275_01410 [Dyadobacter sp. CECT 9275]
MISRFTILALLFLSIGFTLAQPAHYSTAQAHSHNDYEQDIPFWRAYYQQFGSIEADVFLKNDTLFVAHEAKNIKRGKTLKELYLIPLQTQINGNDGRVYPKSDGPIQLLIDIKTESKSTMEALKKELDHYQDILIPRGKVSVVISGNSPSPRNFADYPPYFSFDGRPGIAYTQEELSRIGLISQSFQHYTKWNGKGILVAKEKQEIESVIAQTHSMGKKIRFWATPDHVNAWKMLMNLHVDYLNTDKIEALGNYLKNRKNAEYTHAGSYTPYQPSYKNNDRFSKVRNIILLIGDGMGLAQIYSGLTANHGVLNLSRFLNIGFSKTNASDSYITDSAAGATAMATGHKTRNRAIGVDSNFNAVSNLPELIKPLGIRSALISAGPVTDATPAAFFAHQPFREMEKEIAHDYLRSPVDILIGGDNSFFKRGKIADSLQLKGVKFSEDWQDITSLKTPFVLLDKTKTVPVLQGRGDFLTEAFHKATTELGKGKAGFFMMAEGAQIDYGGHANKLPYVVTEMLDFDKLIGEALKFADSNGETLVIVTADHETGGLSLLDGDFKKGYVDGNFSTNDHTSVMVPVFAYGPHSMDFRGVYENTEIFSRMLTLLKKYHSK